jgi:hypothetical protein
LQNKLLRGVVQALTDEGFVSEAMNAPSPANGLDELSPAMPSKAG